MPKSWNTLTKSDLAKIKCVLTLYGKRNKEKKKKNHTIESEENGSLLMQ